MHRTYADASLQALQQLDLFMAYGFDVINIRLCLLLPLLSSNRYADAVLEAVQQLGLLVSGQTPDRPGIDSDDGWGIFVFFCIIVATVIGWAWYSSSRQNARFKVWAHGTETQSQVQSASICMHSCVFLCMPAVSAVHWCHFSFVVTVM
jgi:hypothetical protein